MLFPQGVQFIQSVSDIHGKGIHCIQNVLGPVFDFFGLEVDFIGQEDKILMTLRNQGAFDSGGNPEGLQAGDDPVQTLKRSFGPSNGIQECLDGGEILFQTLTRFLQVSVHPTGHVVNTIDAFRYFIPGHQLGCLTAAFGYTGSGLPKRLQPFTYGQEVSFTGLSQCLDIMTDMSKDIFQAFPIERFFLRPGHDWFVSIRDRFLIPDAVPTGASRKEPLNRGDRFPEYHPVISS
jgi:hypothetical protein